MVSLPTLKLNFPSCTSITTLAVERKGSPKMIRTSSSSSISKIKKSIGKMNLPTVTNRFSKTPMGAFFTARGPMRHGSVKLPGSPSFWGSSFLVSPLVKLSVAGRGEAGKGGSRVLIPDLVVMTKFDASDLRVHCLLTWRREVHGVMIVPKDHHVLETYSFYSIPSFFFSKRAEAELGELIELPAVNLRYVVVKDLNQKPFLYPMMRYLFDSVLEMDQVSGILSSHSAAFPVREKWKNLNLDVSLVAPSARILSTILK
ncbi:hypothetical protein Tco_1153408 [Tanacetum coccineum]